MLDGLRRPYWVYLLPLIHLCACLTIMVGIVVLGLQYLGIVWSFIMLADLPISLVAYALGWKYSALADLWIIIVGTLWWYLLSRVVLLMVDKLRNRMPAEQNLVPK